MTLNSRGRPLPDLFRPHANSYNHDVFHFSIYIPNTYSRPSTRLSTSSRRFMWPMSGPDRTRDSFRAPPHPGDADDR